jgi:hypothetical protein
MNDIRINGTTGSKRFTWSKEDWQKIGKGLLLALGGVALEYVADTIPQVDFGQFDTVVAAGFAVLLNIARKYLSDTRERWKLPTK